MMNKIKITLFFALILVFSFLFVPQTFAANLLFKTGKANITAGDTFPVTVELTGGEPTLGTDVIIKYEPDMVEAESVKEGLLYPSYQPIPSKRINPVNGTVFISGTAQISKPVAANGSLATITFKALKTGQAEISFDYKEGATNKTGIVNFKGKNLLTSAPQNLTVAVYSPNPFVSFFNGIGNLIHNLISAFKS